MICDVQVGQDGKTAYIYTVIDLCAEFKASEPVSKGGYFSMILNGTCIKVRAQKKDILVELDSPEFLWKTKLSVDTYPTWDLLLEEVVKGSLNFMVTTAVDQKNNFRERGIHCDH